VSKASAAQKVATSAKSTPRQRTAHAPRHLTRTSASAARAGGDGGGGDDGGSGGGGAARGIGAASFTGAPWVGGSVPR